MLPTAGLHTSQPTASALVPAAATMSAKVLSFLILHAGIHVRVGVSGRFERGGGIVLQLGVDSSRDALGTREKA